MYTVRLIGSLRAIIKIPMHDFWQSEWGFQPIFPHPTVDKFLYTKEI